LKPDGSDVFLRMVGELSVDYRRCQSLELCRLWMMDTKQYGGRERGLFQSAGWTDRETAQKSSQRTARFRIRTRDSMNTDNYPSLNKPHTWQRSRATRDQGPTAFIRRLRERLSANAVSR
jgi:hypothetical protein